MTPTAALLEELTETGEDPMKLMTRRLDAAIVDRGGKSIFAAKPRGTLSAEAEQRLAAWALETPRRHLDAPGRKPNDEPDAQKRHEAFR
jgi:hypothetical protein